MKPRRLHSETILSMVTASVVIGGQPYSWVLGKHNLPAICDLPANGRPSRALGSPAGRHGDLPPHRTPRRLAGVALHRGLSVRGPRRATPARSPALAGVSCFRHSYTEPAMPIYEYRCDTGHVLAVCILYTSDAADD